MTASREGRQDVVAVLVHHKADIEAKDKVSALPDNVE